MKTTNEKTYSCLLQLSTLSQYIIPLGNYIFPLLLWTSKKDNSNFIDKTGKNVLNFQLSILLYSLVMILIAVPSLFIWIMNIVNTKGNMGNIKDISELLNMNMSGFVILAIIITILLAFMKISEFFLIIYASIKSGNGEEYKYPLTINFIK